MQTSKYASPTYAMATSPACVTGGDRRRTHDPPGSPKGQPGHTLFKIGAQVFLAQSGDSSPTAHTRFDDRRRDPDHERALQLIARAGGAASGSSAIRTAWSATCRCATGFYNFDRIVYRYHQDEARSRSKRFRAGQVRHRPRLHGARTWKSASTKGRKWDDGRVRQARRKMAPARACQAHTLNMAPDL